MAVSPKKLVQRFYWEVWNRADEMVAREIIDPEFSFRGSLGPERHGHEEFLQYLRSIHAALADYRCIIDELITTDSRAAARMTFTGTHRNVFFGVPATGREITWVGAAFFAIGHSRITRLWVIGDVDAVKRQLGACASASF
jgi:steroid delta-isomerase-like uncharacterized protein